MKLFTKEDIRNIERLTLGSEAITASTLVERVADGVAAEINKQWRTTKRVLVFAGPGNNGADALATSMRLIDMGFNPVVYLFNIGGNSIKGECRKFRDIFIREYPEANYHEIINSFNQPELGPSDIVVDGLFGTGLKEALSGGFMALVRYINESGAKVVSIDLPSGMFVDWNRSVSARNVIHAYLTLAIQFPHISFFLPESAEMTGRWKVLDVGMSREAIEQTKSAFHLMEEAEIRSLLRPRNPFSSKADFGSACIVAGRYGMTGAAVLACRGALRAGAGKVTLYGPQCAFQIAQTSVPEAMFEADENQLMVTDIRLDKKFTSFGIGPGLGTSDSTMNAVETFIKRSVKPLVIDADALNCLAQRPSLIHHLPMRSVLTPHAGEFDRMFGEHINHEARLLKALEVAHNHNILILLKGRYTALVRPDGKVYFNSSGTPALATPGSGDVLTGIITAFIAQDYKPEVSALLGAYIHGKAGELAAEKHGEYGVTASDVANAVGQAIMNVMQSQRNSFE